MKEDLIGGQAEKDDENNNNKETSSKDKSKSKRKCSSPWKLDDTKWFFEALAEFGKDFSSIQTYIAARVDKKVSNPPEQVKNREQVRHYYYRTWHKIATVLQFPDFIDKQTQELYGLINFGEIWKKLGSKTEAKIKVHLNELINTGQTVVKFKGKNLKIKTPVCKALKKLHKLDDHPSSSSSVHNLPKEITLEFHPTSNDAWLRVHSLAQNPRIRIRSPLQKRLSEIITYLERRWSTLRYRSLMMTTHNRSSSPTMELEPEKLRVFIHSSLLDDLTGIVIKRVPLNFNAQIDLSLSAFISKFHQNGKELPEKRKKSVSGLSSNSSNKTKVTETVTTTTTITTTTTNEAKDTTSSTNQSKEETNKVIDIEEKSILPPIAETVRSLSMLQDMLALANSDTTNDAESIVTSGGVGAGGGSGISSTLESCSRVEEEVNLNEKTIYIDENSKSEVKNSNTILPLPPANATIGEWLGAFISNGHDDDSNNNNTDSTIEDVNKNDADADKDGQSTSSTATSTATITTATNNTETEIINNNNNNNNYNNNNSNNNNPVITNEDKYQTVNHIVDIDTLRNGWTSDTSDLLVGELYLMLKNPEKIILEYDWVKDGSKQRQDDLGDCPSTMVKQSSQNTNDSIKSDSIDSTQTVLDKLITVASIALSHLKNQQIGGDSNNLVLSPVKSKSYSRKNKRLKLGSPPPILHHQQAQASPSSSHHHQTPSLLTLSSSSLSTSGVSSSLHHISSTSICTTGLTQDRLISDSLSSSSNILLSNLISDTILNDNIYSDLSNATINVTKTSTGDKIDYLDSSSPPKIDASQWFNNHSNFTSPNFNKITTKQPSKPVRCNDPALLQEAIKQLNSNKFNTRKQLRKPTYITKPQVIARCSPNVIGVTLSATTPGGGQSTTASAMATANQIINHVVKSGGIKSQLTGQTVQLPVVIPSSEGNIVVSQAPSQTNYLAANPDAC